jgi:hypothetical protein
MATKGRDGDSMLVHMTPGEVAGLHALAVRHGGELTINPDTGLPEANFLKKLLPTIIGAGLSFIPGVGPLMAAGIVGGFETIRTGDIGRGLSAGLGAYGGAGLAQSLAGSGVSALGANASTATQLAADTAVNEATRMGVEQGLTGSALDALKRAAIDDIGASTIGKEAIGATMADKLSTGLGAVTKDPASAGAFLKGNAKNLMYAAGPAIMAGANVENKLPQTLTKPGMIRPFSYDPYSGTYTALEPYEATPTRAAEGGLMGMADGGYNPGDLAFAERSEPVMRMAEGGIATLAAGGVSDQDVQNWFATNAGATDAQIAAAMQQYKVAPEQVARVTGVGMPEVQQRFETAIAPQIVGTYTGGIAGPGGTTATRGTGYLGIQDQLENAGVTAQELFNNPNYKGWSLPELEQAYNVANKIQQFDTGANSAALDDKAWAAFMDANKFSVRNIAQATGLSEAEVQRRYDAAKAPVIKPPIVTTTTTTPTVTTTPPVITTQDSVNDLANVGIDRLLPGVSGGGNTVVNANGTITTRPDFSLDMKTVRDKYTQGGGSLGYIPYVPTSIADFEAKYNRTKGGSRQALDYLMGKGDYPVAPYTPTGEIQKPYLESVGRMPTDITTKKYLFQNGRYVENPDYIPPVYKDGVRSAGLTTNEVIKGIEPFKNAGDDLAMFDWMTENNVSEQQLATALNIPRLEARARIAAAKRKRKDINDREAAVKAAAASGSEGAADGGVMRMAAGGLGALARGGSASQYNLGDYSDGGRLLRGPGDGVSDSIPASIGNKRPARLADGEFVVPARIVSELGNGSTEAGARKLYAMMDRVQRARRKTTGKRRVATNTRADKYLPA